MDPTSFTLFVNASIYFVTSLIMSGFFVICIYLRFKRKQDLPQLIHSLVFGLIGFWFLFEYYFALFLGQNVEMYVLLGLMVMNWSNYCMYLHYEAIIALIPQSGIRHQIVLSFAIGVTLIELFKLIGYLQPFPLVDFFVLSVLLGLTAFSIALLNVAKGHKLLKERGTRWDLIALSIMIGGPITYTSVGIYAIINGQIMINNDVAFLGGSFLVTGLMIILFNYIKNNYLYRLPYPVLFVSLYAEDGSLIYSSKGHRSTGTTFFIQEELISKLFLTVNTLVKGVIHSGSKLKLIQTWNYKIIFSQTPQKLTFCLVTPNASYFLKRSIDRFLEQLPPNLLARSGIDSEQEIGNLIKKTFTGLINGDVKRTGGESHV